MSHDHSHDGENLSDKRLVFAVALNLLLTVVEAVAGLLAGSLALMADALHNFNDCGSLVIALVARRIGRRPSDERRTFSLYFISPSHNRKTACGRSAAAMSIALMSWRLLPDARIAFGSHSARCFLFGAVAGTKSGAATG